MAAKKSGIDQNLVRDLAKLLQETDLNEIEVEEGDMRIRLARGGTVQTIAAAPVATAVAAPTATIAPSPMAAEPKPSSAGNVPSPMVGTAYLASGPDAAPYVSIGSKVSEGQTILIIEAMKTMNQISAPHSGTLKEVLVEDGQPVEFGEQLMSIE